MRAFCTIVSRSHLHFAFTLSVSLRDSGNSESLHILVVDAVEEDVSDCPEGCVLHSISSLDLSLPSLMKYYFDAFELCNALKPFLVKELLNRECESVIYLDSDILVTSSFDPIWSSLNKNEVVVSPHQLSPLPRDVDYLKEVDVIDMGIYNGGFSAWQVGEGAGALLDWMCDRFPRYAFNRRKDGMFVDQKLMSLVGIHFPEKVLVTRDPCVNIAFWNAHERFVERRGNGYFVGDEPVIFFHLSGFRMAQPDLICSYLSVESNRKILSQANWFSDLLKDYARRLKECSPESPPEEYRFSHFNGIRLSPSLRMRLFTTGALSLLDPVVLKLIFLEFLRSLKRWICRYT